MAALAARLDPPSAVGVEAVIDAALPTGAGGEAWRAGREAGLRLLPVGSAQATASPTPPGGSCLKQLV